MGGRRAHGHLTLSQLLGTHLTTLPPPSQSSLLLFGAVLVSRRLSVRLAATGMFVTLLVIRRIPYRSESCVMLVLVLSFLFWRIGC